MGTEEACRVQGEAEEADEIDAAELCGAHFDYFVDCKLWQVR